MPKDPWPDILPSRKKAEKKPLFSKKVYVILLYASMAVAGCGFGVAVTHVVIAGISAEHDLSLRLFLTVSIVGSFAGGIVVTVHDKLIHWYYEVSAGVVLDKGTRSSLFGTKYRVLVWGFNRVGTNTTAWRGVETHDQYEKIVIGQSIDLS